MGIVLTSLDIDWIPVSIFSTGENLGVTVSIEVILSETNWLALSLKSSPASVCTPSHASVCTPAST